MTNAIIEFTNNKEQVASALSDVLTHVEKTFPFVFHLFTAEGTLVHRAPVPCNETDFFQELLRVIANKMQAEFISQEPGITWLVLPLSNMRGERLVLAAPIVTELINFETVRIAASLGCSLESAKEWLAQQKVWPMHTLEPLVNACMSSWHEKLQLLRMQRENDKLSEHLSSCYEEISLMQGITKNFRISMSDEALGTLSLEWVSECVACESVCIVYLPQAKASETTYKARTEPRLIAQGNCPLTDPHAVLELVDQIGMGHNCRPMVINHNRSELMQHLPSGVRQLIVAPLVEDKRVFAYLLAFNHKLDLEFGTVEANLLASVGAMLGIHCANRDLYREQAELLANVVRALTSSIDAKDQYTCGHSDRVARVATRLAFELGCDKEFLSSIYMAGLLHDIGKIGIDDAVLRKPGKLTPEEFDHIKKHPEFGYKILADIKQLAHVLPAVLHHHEQWDGRGYPCQLSGEQIPYIARIVAVADAYDAMTSSRPYRPGMPVTKVAAIFREGAGQQWDAEVINAFFACEQEIHGIVENDRAGLSLDVQQWLKTSPISKAENVLPA
jgi:putative nucleotidyltransferase with HDIG domain